jgi:hypothetical protein
MWYSSTRQLTYNRIFNFAVGVRGGGKTLNSLRESIEKHIKEKENGRKWEFLYLRRRVVDLDDACAGKKGDGDLFSDLRAHGYFEGHELKVVSDKSGGYNFYCDGEIMGYGKALSTAASRRSTSKPYVKRILFDEFLIDDTAGSNIKYLNGGEEYFLFLNFYETIARGRDIPVIFIGNAFSMVNPYFIGLGIRIQNIENNKIYKGKSWTVIFWRDEEFIKSREKTQFYQAIEGTKMHDHAFNNSFYLDKNDFIKKKSQDSEHQFSLVYLGKTYGVWVDWEKGIYFVSQKGAKTSRHKTISMSLADNKPNNINIRRYRNMPFIKAFRMAADNNSIYYDSQEAYNMMNEVVYLLKTIT